MDDVVFPRSLREQAARTRARSRALRAACADVRADLAATLDRLAATATRLGREQHAEELRRAAARVGERATPARSDGLDGGDRQPTGPVERPRASSTGAPDGR